uniref:Uncharacterized protein n=2 Tax=Schistocephalus solidus TaxID=70667 RepID=A0A0V0J8Y9_SCHSO
MKNFTLLLILISVVAEDYFMLMEFHELCMRPPNNGFYKVLNSDDLLLHNQIVLYWNSSSTRNSAPSSHRASTHSPSVCPGVTIRPAGRYVRRFLSDGAVYFWLLHAQATITCPAQQPTPSAEEFQITFEQWLDSSAPGSKSVETEEAYDRGDSFYLPDHYIPETVNLSCDDTGRGPQVHVNLTDRLRILRIKWKFFPSLQPQSALRELLTARPPSDGISRTPPNLPDPDLLDRATTASAAPPSQLSLLMLPPGFNVRIQITSRLHFGGNFSLARKRELCDLYGFWCSPTSAVAAAAAEEENETSGTCIRSSMLCDGFPDCWLDDPENSPDEVGCKVPLQPEPDSPSFTNMLNGSLIPESYPSTRGQSWSTKLPWLVAAFVPVVLLCALVRICSQRRQLDFADEVHPEQNAPDGQPGVTYGGTPMAQIRLPAPRYKIPPTKRGLLWAAGLRRTRSSGQLGCGGPDDYPKEFQLQPKRSVQQLYGGEDLRSSKHKIEEADEEAETAVSDGNQKEMVKTSLPTSDATCLHGPEDRSRPKCCNLQIDMRQPCDADLLISASPCKSRLTNRQKVTGRLNSDPQSREHFRLPSSLLLSCWSELSPSSSSSDSALPTTAPSTAPPGIDDCCLRGENDPEVFFSYRFNGQTEREDEEEEEEDSCAVCRQMRESGCIPNEAEAVESNG